MKRKSMIFNPHSISVEFEGHPTVLEVAEHERLPLNNSCGGMGTCGTCMVIIESDLALLPERGEVEREFARDRGYSQHERLACQIEALDRLIVKIP
jgi:ferredoxin, 2Fe-2S